jgi:hypothetical protein
MFRVIQIDPETLAIQLNAGAISVHSRSVDLFNFVDAARVDGILAPLLVANNAGDMDLLSFGTSYLHELRHFADLLLTPFGFYRIRTAFEFFRNLPYLVFASDGEIPIPLMSGMDPITRTAIGVGPGFEESVAYRLGLTSFSRVRVINAENHYDPANLSIRYGGDRILEALAYITQFEFLFQKCDTPKTRQQFSSFFNSFEGSEFDLSYRWFTPDCHKLHPSETMPNNTLMMAILFASLCGSIPVTVPPSSTLHRNQPPSRDVGEKLPSVRYRDLIDHFKENPRPSIDEPDEAFELVDAACKNLFGLGIADEIEEDLRYSQNFVEAYSQTRQEGAGVAAQFNPIPMLAELIEYRKLLVNDFKSDPKSFCTSQGFYEQVAPALRPTFIYHNLYGILLPEGVRYSRLPGQSIGLFDRRMKPPKTSEGPSQSITVAYATWSPLLGDNGSHIEGFSTVIEDREQAIGYIANEILASRQGVYGLLAPLFRWILYGNKSRNISEAENDRWAAALGLDENRFVIDPFYEEAEDISLPDAFLEFFCRAENYCDICGSRVAKDNSYLVSARTMRQNPAVVEFYRARGADFEFRFLKLDWSDWLVCHADMERFNLPVPRRTSAEPISQ